MEKKCMVQFKAEKEAVEIAKVVQIANQFQSKVYLHLDDNCKINAKSIMGMMNFFADNPSEVTVWTNGIDEETALEAICDCLMGKV